MLGQMIREQIQFAGAIMPRGIDSEVGTLEDPNEDNDPLIIRIPRDNMKGECRFSLGWT